MYIVIERTGPPSMWWQSQVWGPFKTMDAASEWARANQIEFYSIRLVENPAAREGIVS